MKILVQDHYGFKKIYEGSPMDVEHGLLRDFPWLDYLKTWNRPHAQRLRMMLGVLGRAQIYEVKVLDNLMADGIEYDSSLYKAVDHNDIDFGNYLPDTVREGKDYDKEHVDTTRETTPHTTLKETYKKHVIDSPEKVKPDFNAHRNLGGITQKVVFRGVPSHLPEGSDFMVKPYTTPAAGEGYTEGWQEMTSQALYHAAGLGDYHQRVHVEKHPISVGFNNPKEIPALVIHMEPDHETMDQRQRRYDVKKSPDHETYKADAKKMFLMDFLANQMDRHEGNLMFHRETGKPLVIDNGYGFHYTSPRYNPKPMFEGGPLDWHDHFINHSSIGYGRNVFHHLSPIDNKGYDTGDYDEFFRPALDWWKEKSPKIQAEFANRLLLIQDPVHKEKLREGFNARAAMLDKWAKEGLKPEPRPEVKTETPKPPTEPYPKTGPNAG